MEQQTDEMKLRSAELLNQLRNYKRNVCEKLRERYRQQMRKNRQDLFDMRRERLNDRQEKYKGMSTGIVRKEINKMSKPVSNTNNKNLSDSNSDLIYHKDIADIEDENERENQLMLESYIQMAQYDDDEFINEFIEDILKDEVICPICQTATIEEFSEGLICPGCKLVFPKKFNIAQLSNALHDQLNVHNSNCLAQPNFSIIPEKDYNSLCLICDTCSTFATII